MIIEETECLCGCGRSFIDTTTNKSRVFFDRKRCRYKYYKDNGTYTKISENHAGKGTYAKDNDKEFRRTICHRKGILPDANGVRCANYSECSDGVADGKPWKYELNGREDCFKEPKREKINVCGRSFAKASTAANYT